MQTDQTYLDKTIVLTGSAGGFDLKTAGMLLSEGARGLVEANGTLRAARENLNPNEDVQKRSSASKASRLQRRARLRRIELSPSSHLGLSGLQLVVLLLAIREGDAGAALMQPSAHLSYFKRDLSHQGMPCEENSTCECGFGGRAHEMFSRARKLPAQVSALALRCHRFPDAHSLAVETAALNKRVCRDAS